MHMIFLDVERTNGPGVRFTDTTNLLFDKWSDLPNENLLALLGTPDKMIAQLYVTCLVCCASIHNSTTFVLDFQ